MKKTRISESQIIKALKDFEPGTSTEIICREYGISRATLYLWKKKYSGVDVSQLKRLKELEEENRRPKHMYAELHGPEYAAFESGLTGRNFKEGNSGDLANVIVELLLNNESRSLMKRNVQKIAREKYNVDIMVERFIETAKMSLQRG